MFMLFKLLLTIFVCSGVVFVATARPLLDTSVALRSRRVLATFASCNEYTAFFETEAIDYGGATCECSFGETSNEWVASCLYNCDLCLESGCFALSYQRYSVGVEWECLDYRVQSPSAGKLCTLYDESATELVVSINDEYCLASAPNPMCSTGYEYDCSNIGGSVVCNENDTGDAIWQIVFDESEELCTVGTCVDDRTTTFPKRSGTYMAPKLSPYQEGFAGSGGDGVNVAVSLAARQASSLATFLPVGFIFWLVAYAGWF